MSHATVVKLLLAAVLGLALTTEMVRAETVAPPEPVPRAANRYDTDCVHFRFRPDDAAVSPTAWLRSREWVLECRWRGDPRNGGRRECWERPGPTHQEWVRITLRDRKPLLPWESDTFQACLQGPWLSLRAIATAYEYRHAERPWRGDFVLAPGAKLATRADPRGLAPEALSERLLLAVKDKWASYYEGERTGLKVTIRREVPNWPDPKVAELSLEDATRAARELDLLAAARWSEAPRPGQRYYAALSFRRLGAVSRPDWEDAGESPRASYRPALTGAAAR